MRSPGYGELPPPVVPIVDEGLGNTAYVVDLGDGRALAIDPSLDVRAVTAHTRRHGLRVAFAAETHLHADFLSGSLQLAATDQAVVLAAAAGGREFTHQGLREGDEVDLGGLTLRALETPGHTPEHLSYLLLDGARPLAVFSGGSLIVGAAARTDLAGGERTEELARAQYRSLHRLVSELPDATLVLPTHGAGSFCSAPAGASRVTTVGAERASNPLLAAPDEDAFVRLLLGGLGSYPAYFDRLAELNRRGPPPVTAGPGTPALDPLGVAEVVTLRDRGAQLVDVRPFRSFAAGHVPGSLSIELRPAFATWLGWLVDPGRSVVFVRDEDQDAEEIRWQAAKIGYDSVGELAGGLAAWRAAGHATRSVPVIDAATADPARVLDVRQRAEFVAGHLPGARHLELARLAGNDGLGPVQTMCGHGERAATAASLLAAAGHPEVTIVTGGPGDWAAEHDAALQVGA